MKQVELWKVIEEYQNYEVSNYGRVRSLSRNVTQKGHKKLYTRVMEGKMLKQRKQNAGYMIVWLCKDGKKKAFTVHRLVALAFLEGNGTDVNHIDGNKLNNVSSNLEYVSRSENLKHAYRKLCRTRHQQKRVMCIETGIVYDSIKEASLKTGANAVSIGHCLAGRNKTAGGFTWSTK